MAVIRTLLVDDHPLFAETVATRLSREPDLDVLPVAASEAQALALIRALAPDVVVLDLMLGSRSGLGVLDDIVTRQPCSRVVVLTAASPTEHAVDAIQRGARAWLPKTVDANHLVRVIRGVFLGESWISPDLLGYILGQLASTPRSTTNGPLDVLTARERDVLQCAVDGLSRIETARRLYVSPHTVRTHTQNIAVKLGTHTILETVSFARRCGLRPVLPPAGRGVVPRTPPGWTRPPTYV